MKLLWILLVALLSAGAQLCQKQATRTPGGAWGWLLLSLGLMGGALILWLWVLGQVPVSLAYPMLSLNFVLVAIFAQQFWDERFQPGQWLGLLLIICGVSLIGMRALE